MILDRFSLKGKNAIVTGAGRGIGKGIALAFAEAGAQVACSDQDEESAARTAAAIQAMGGSSMSCRCNIRDEEQVNNMVHLTKEEFGRIDILVNNAGAGFFKPAMAMSMRAWESMLQINLTGAFLCSKAVAAIMLEQKSGSIISISSRESQMPSLGMIAYGAAKAGINSMTRTLAWELAPHIRVNAILPGSIWTEGSSMALGPVKDKIISNTPLKRMGAPEDIALAAIYLASPASDFVTGKLFEIDGGIEFTPITADEILEHAPDKDR